MSYAIGQKFGTNYPPEAAIWCNENGAVMAPVDGGFEIQVCPTPTAKQLYTSLRVERDVRLARTDKMLLPDYPISADALEQVKVYRAALRDLPAQPGAPWDGGGVETPWPTKPEV